MPALRLVQISAVSTGRGSDECLLVCNIDKYICLLRHLFYRLLYRQFMGLIGSSLYTQHRKHKEVTTLRNLFIYVLLYGFMCVIIVETIK